MNRTTKPVGVAYLLVASVWLTVGLTVGLSIATGQDWTAIRGNDGHGSATPGGVLSTGSPMDLEIVWKKKIGSGYSSVVIAGNRVVTMFSDGKHDLVICLDKSSGDTVWQAVSGPHFHGENGSFDGPMATPLIHDGHVFALDPGGKLLCLDLVDGKEVWSTDLMADLGAIQPLYGFSTSPIAVGDTIIVQTGVQRKSLAGLEPKSGNVKWAVSNDTISSQTPAVVHLGGTAVVVAAGGEKLTGVDPSIGNILFEYEHQGGNGSAMVPVPMENNRVLLTLDDSFSRAVELRDGDDHQIDVSEVWQDRSIKNTYNVPVAFEGNLFAFSTRILTCVDAESGKAVWKSREPGDGFLIAIDGHLIINTKKGGLHVARATRDGYQEVARLDLFSDLVWSIPAYSDNAVYVRSLGEIARVELVARGRRDLASDEPDLPMGKEFAKLVGFLNTHPQPQVRSAAITEYLDDQSSFPVIEDDVVHFFYRGPGDDVALASDILGSRQEKKMHHVEGTDVFYYTLRLEDDQRANYVFLVDYKPQTDPRNPRTVTSSIYAGEMEFAIRLPDEKPLEMSWFGMPGWHEPEYLKSLPEKLRGTIVKHSVESEHVDGGIDVEIYTPPGYQSAGQRRYRTVYVFGGPAARPIGKLAAAADNLFAMPGHDASSAILVFVNAPPGPGLWKAITDDVIALVDSEYLTKADRQHRALAGFGFAAGGALSTLDAQPDLFSALALQSPLLFSAAQAAAVDTIDKVEHPFKVYIDWGRFDMNNPHENWDVRAISQRFHDHCKSKSHLRVSGGMVNDSADWASWRNRYEDVLMLGADDIKVGRPPS